jgi:hypothetical protein
MFIIGPTVWRTPLHPRPNAQDNTYGCSGSCENITEARVTSHSIMLAYDDVLLELDLSTVRNSGVSASWPKRAGLQLFLLDRL